MTLKDRDLEKSQKERIKLNKIGDKEANKINNLI